MSSTFFWLFKIVIEERPSGRSIFTGIGDSRNVGTILSHNVNLVRSAAVAREGNQLAVGRPGRMFVVARVVRQLHDIGAIESAGINIHMAVVHRGIGDAVTFGRPSGTFIVAAHKGHAA